MILEQPDVLRLVDHLERHHAENGRGGSYFMPPQPFTSMLHTYDAAAWNGPPGQGAWQRVWGWADGLGVIRAHCVVTANALTPHRCTLAMGVEAPFRRQGHGRALMAEALAWVCEQPSIAWVDGWAFAHNEAVLKLDDEMGFREIGRLPDLVRVNGQSLAQVFMVIELKQGGCSWQQERR